MKNVFLAFTVLAAALAGCSRKQANSPEDLQKAFANSTASASALNTAKPEVKIWVDQAVTAIKNDDQATAVMSLRSLRSSGQLTADQIHAMRSEMDPGPGRDELLCGLDGALRKAETIVRSVDPATLSERREVQCCCFSGGGHTLLYL